MNLRKAYLIPLIATLLLLSACKTKKAAISEGPVTPVVVTPPSDDALMKQKLEFVKKVAATATKAENITSKIDFGIKMGEKEISVSGKLFMKRDDVIRIQLSVPILGMEAGRLEFTKDYVMIVDRIHTQYVKADYTQVDFLKNNGLNFNALQALFWNQLFVPGKEHVSESDLKAFNVELGSAGNDGTVSLERDHMKYTWKADARSALIRQTDVDYQSNKSGATHVKCTYDEFKSFSGKPFPNNIVLDLNTTATQKARNMQMNIKMKKPSDDSDWEPRTTLSKKYKEVSVDDVMKQLMSVNL